MTKLPRTPFNSPTTASRVKYFPGEVPLIKGERKQKVIVQHSSAKVCSPILCEKCRSCLHPSEIQATKGMMNKGTDSEFEEMQNCSFALNGRSSSKIKKKKNSTCLKKNLTKQPIEQRSKAANSTAQRESDSISKAPNSKNISTVKGKRQRKRKSRKKNTVEDTNISPKKQLALHLSQIETLRRVNEVLEWEAKRKVAIARAEKLRRMHAGISKSPLLNGTSGSIYSRRKGRFKSKVPKKSEKPTITKSTKPSSRKQEIQPKNIPCRPAKGKMTDNKIRSKGAEHYFHHRQLRTSKGGIKLIVMMQNDSFVKPEANTPTASLEYVKDKDKHRSEDEMPLKFLSSNTETDEESVVAKDKERSNSNDQTITLTKYEEEQLRLTGSDSEVSNGGSILEQTTWNCVACGFENSCQDSPCILCGNSGCMNEDNVVPLNTNLGIDDNVANGNKIKDGNRNEGGDESDIYSQDSFE